MQNADGAVLGGSAFFVTRYLLARSRKSSSVGSAARYFNLSRHAASQRTVRNRTMGEPMSVLPVNRQLCVRMASSGYGWLV